MTIADVALLSVAAAIMGAAMATIVLLVRDTEKRKG